MLPQSATKSPRTKRGFSVPSLPAFPVELLRRTFAAKHRDSDTGSDASTPRSKSSGGPRLEHEIKDSAAVASADSLGLPVIEKSESKAASQKTQPSAEPSTLGLFKRRLSLTMTSLKSSSSSTLASPVAGSEPSTEATPRVTKEAGVYTLDFRSDPTPLLFVTSTMTSSISPGLTTGDLRSNTTKAEEGGAGDPAPSSPSHSRSKSAFSFSDSHILSPRNRKFICKERLMWESGDSDDAGAPHLPS